MPEKESKSLVPDEVISSKIYFIRDKNVMLDKDLAELYCVETRVLNQAVQRNKERFPEDFMFQLSAEEYEILISQFVTSSWGGTRKMPYAFTEQGVAMLSSVLRSKQAIRVNIQIMRIFTRFKELLADNLNLYIEIEKIKKKIANQDQNIELVFSYLDELIEKKRRSIKKIGFRRSNERD